MVVKCGTKQARLALWWCLFHVYCALHLTLGPTNTGRYAMIWESVVGGGNIWAETSEEGDRSLILQSTDATHASKFESEK